MGVFNHILSVCDRGLVRAGIPPARFGYLFVLSIVLAFLGLEIFHALKMVWWGVDDALIMPNGIGVGADFIAVWSAGYLASIGQAAQAYSDEALLAAHQMAIPASDATFPWFYPPVFQLFALPFGMMPYLAALVVYVGGLAALYVWMLWRIRPRAGTLLMGLSYPGLWLCMMAGQNGTLSALLLGSGLLMMMRGLPQRAGLFWGLMCYKPQLAIPLGVATLVSRTGRRAIFPALAVGIALCCVSFFVLGRPSWSAFVVTSSRLTGILAQGSLPMDHMISVYATFWRAGLEPLWAFVAQVFVAATALCVVGALWWRNARREGEAVSFALKGAALVWAILLTTPHLFQYETPIAGVGLLLMWVEAERTGWRRGEKAVLFFAWMAPVLVDYAFFPALSLVLLWLCWRRL